MTVIADFLVDAEDFAIGQVLSHTTTRIDLTQFVPIDETLAPYFWKETDGDREHFERQVRADDRVQSLTDLDGRVGARLYYIEWAVDINGLLSALHDHDILVEKGRSNADGDRWMFHVRAWDRAELSSFQRTCLDNDVPVDIQRMQHNPDGTHLESVPKRRLTAKQREAVLTALREGYFDIPRGVSQTDIAEQLGISRQSFARRLKRAQRTVFEDLFWEELTTDR